MWKIMHLLLCCGFVLAACCGIWAEPITFARALELSHKQAALADSNVKSDVHCRTEDFSKRPSFPGTPDHSDAGQESFLSEIYEDAGDQEALRPGSFRKSSETAYRYVDRRDLPCDVVMTTAVEYIQLVWAAAHLAAREQQHELARRLVVVERRRVHAGVDDEVMLFRAKLLEAQSRMRIADAGAEVLELRQALAVDVGMPEATLEVVPESIPALPTLQDYGGPEQTVASRDQFELVSVQVKQMRAARDAAQLVYVLAHRDALRATGSPTATLGDQIRSQIREIEKFGVLLDAAVELEESELGLLHATGGLERWATATAQLTPNLVVSGHRSEQAERQLPSVETQCDSVRSGKDSPQTMNVPSMETLVPSPKKTLLVLPSDSVLTVRNSRQFEAVGIGIGGGKDVTSDSRWCSSNESVAIVSTTGLITAIGRGDAAITADFDGVSRKIRITVVDNHP
jgi:hypothetical protein